MVTNQVMKRHMGSFDIFQRTKDGFFNATMLLAQWNSSSGMQKQMSHYFQNSSTEELTATIMREENLKERNSVVLSSRGKNGGTWMHPVLFIDFAMWLNPSFRYHALKFVYDQMIKFRNDAGDAYRDLSAAIAKISSKTDMQSRMKKVAEALNYVVFAEHYPNIRNDHGSEAEMQDLLSLERKLADLINEGFITDFDSLITYLRIQWSKRRAPQCLK